MTTATQDDDNVMENKESETGVRTTRNIPRLERNEGIDTLVD